MRRWVSVGILILALLITMPGTADAHAPKFPAGNDTLENAYIIDDVSKSLVIYNRLDGGVDYYRFTINDERLLLQILVPPEDLARGLRPHIVLMMPNWTEGGALPAEIDVPDGYGYEILTPTVTATPEYEGITATAFHVLIDFDEYTSEFHDGEGTFFIAVYDSSGVSGNYALVVGYEERFTLSELLWIPFDLIGIYQWQGSSLTLIVTPILLFLMMGVILMSSMRNNDDLDLNAILGISGGSLMIGTASTVTIQMLIAVSNSGLSSGLFMTSLLIIMGLAGGASTILLTVERGEIKRWRALLVFAAFLGLLSFNGLLLGPAMTLAAAIRGHG